MTIKLDDYRGKPDQNRIEYRIALNDNGFIVYADGCAIIHADNIGDSDSFEVIEDRNNEYIRTINLKFIDESKTTNYNHIKYGIDKV